MRHRTCRVSSLLRYYVYSEISAKKKHVDLTERWLKKFTSIYSSRETTKIKLFHESIKATENSHATYRVQELLENNSVFCYRLFFVSYICRRLIFRIISPEIKIIQNRYEVQENQCSLMKKVLRDSSHIESHRTTRWTNFSWFWKYVLSSHETRDVMERYRKENSKKFANRFFNNFNLPLNTFQQSQPNTLA